MIAVLNRLRKMFTRNKLSALEQLILDAVMSAVGAEHRLALKCQLDSLLDVSRVDDGAKIYFIFNTDASNAWGRSCRLSIQGGDVKIAELDLDYYRHDVRAELWAADGVLSRIEYPNPAIQSDFVPNHLKVRRCVVQMKQS